MRHIGMPRGSMRTLPEHTHFIRGLRWIERVLVAAVIFCAVIAVFVWIAPWLLEAMAK